MSYILFGILAFLFFRFFTGFVWPVYKATKAAKKQFEQMRTQAPQNPFEQEVHSKDNPSKEEKPKYDLGGEYISYEEIKEK
jgi:hypothetical protein